MGLNVWLLGVVTVLAFHSASAVWKKSPEHPWGNVIDWVTMEEAYRGGKERGVPIMLIIWRTGCPACEDLKKTFPTNKELIFASRHLSMVEAEVPKYPWTKDPKFDVDGQYVPRIYFLSPDGEIIKDVYNEAGNSRYKYYYPSEHPLPAIMKRVAKDYIKKRDEL